MAQIRGSLPPVPHPEAGSPDTVGTWLTAAEVAATTDFKRTARQQGYLQAAYQARVVRCLPAGMPCPHAMRRCAPFF